MDRAGVAAALAGVLRVQVEEFGLSGVGFDLAPPGGVALQAPSGKPDGAVGVAPPGGVAPHAPSGKPDGASLDQIRLALGDCQRCKLARTRTTLVFGTGREHADLMLVGEGPGRDEDLQGEPFVGESGRLLDRMLAAMGLRRHDVYIANIVKCRPPRNRDPEPDEVAACAPVLRRQVAAVRPRVIVALGRYAAQTLLGESTAISHLRGQWRSYANIPLMPTFHPSYLLRQPGEKRAVWHDLQAVMRRLAGLTPGPERVQ